MNKKYIKILKFIVIMICCIHIVGCNTTSVDKTEDETKNITEIPETENTVDSNKVTPTEGVDISNPTDQNVSITDTVIPDAVTPDVVPTQPVNVQNTSTDNDYIGKTETFELEDFKNIIINIVNDDLWYKTPEQSNFHPFESHTMDVEIYTNQDKPYRIWVIFHDPINNKDRYVGVAFESDKRGFLNEYNVFFVVSTNQEAESMMGDGFIFYKKIEISFGEATKPVYTETTPEKEEVVNNILEAITYKMKLWKYDEGEYTIYVRNFRDNSSRTSAVIENGLRDKWIMEIDVFDDGSSEVNIVEELDADTLVKWSELIKDNTVRVENVALE